MTTEQAQALQFLFDHATQSRLLPPAALPELQKAAKLIQEALKPKQQEDKKDEKEPLKAAN